MKDQTHTQLVALPVTQKETTFYVAVISAAKLIGLCAGLKKTISAESEGDIRTVEEPEDIKKLLRALNEPSFAKEISSLQDESYGEQMPYQRIYDESRARSIANYLREEDAMLPNGVILAVRDDVDANVRPKGSTVEIDLEWEAGNIPLNIIDGQHRVEGLRKLLREFPDEFASFELTATILLDVPFWAQAQLFAVVNGRQKQVPRSRVYDLLGYLPMSDSETRSRAYQGEMAVQRFCHHVVRALNRSEKSPWHARIKMRGAGTGIISQAALVDHLSIYLLPRKQRTSMRVLPVLYRYYREADVVGLAKLLIIYFIGLRRAHEGFWVSDAAIKSSLFGKTNGVAVMLQILHDMILLSGGPEKMSVEFVAEHWKKVPSDVIANPPKGGSKGYQDELAKTILREMFGKDFAELLSTANKKQVDVLKGEGAIV